jgi:glycosyltransferase involved in cell wall biosynthesis
MQSVQQRTYPNFGIIVVDDGPPVPAAPVLPESSGVLMLRTENQGCPAGEKPRLPAESGDFLVFLDSDDRLMPGALEAHLKSFCRRPHRGELDSAYRAVCGLQPVAKHHLCSDHTHYGDLSGGVFPFRQGRNGEPRAPVWQGGERAGGRWAPLLPSFFEVEWVIRRFLPKYVSGLVPGSILLLSVLFLSLIQSRNCPPTA